MSTRGRSSLVLRKNVFTLAALAALMSAVLGFTSCGEQAGSAGSADDEVAATVNGVNIPVSKIDTLIDQRLKSEGPGAPPLTPVALAAARLQVLDTLIQEEALYQRAQRENLIPADDEVRQAIQEQIQQSGLSQDAFQQKLKEIGQSEDEFRSQTKRNLAIEKLQKRITTSIPAPTDAEIRKLFDENKAQFVAPRGLELADIIVDPRNNGAKDDAVGDEAANRKAQEILASLRSGLDFATVARSRSEDQSALQGGLIGFFSEEQIKSTFPPDVASSLFNLQVGGTLGPIQGSDGRWHIFKLNGKRNEAKDLTYEEVSPQIAKNITDQRAQVVLSALVTDVLSTSTVKNNLAERILKHPDTFGALRPSPLTQPKPDQAPAAPATEGQAKPQPAPAEAQPSGEAKPAAQPAGK